MCYHITMFQIVSQRSLENHCCWCGDGEMVRGVPGWLVTTAGVESDWSLDWDSWIWVDMHSRVDYKILVLDKHEIYCPLTLNCPHGFNRLKWSLSIYSFQQKNLYSSMSKFGVINMWKQKLSLLQSSHLTWHHFIYFNNEHETYCRNKYLFYYFDLLNQNQRKVSKLIKMCWYLVDTVF